MWIIAEFSSNKSFILCGGGFQSLIIRLKLISHKMEELSNNKFGVNSRKNSALKVAKYDYHEMNQRNEEMEELWP